MKRQIAGTAAALLAAVLFLPLKVHAVSAQKAIVLDAVSNRILYEKNADDRSLIASTTKIMTALLVCERCNVLDRMRIPKEAVGIEGSSMYLREGEVLTLQELLYGLMLSSGNDAATALAIYCGGTVEGFVQLMNDKAHALGMTETSFANPSGLDDPNHYSTARDMAVLAQYAMDNPIFAKTVTTKNITAGTRYLKNHNKLLWLLDGTEGVKTGYTKAAGRTLVSSAQRNGRRIIAVTLNAPDDWNDHCKLLENGFYRFSVQQVVTAGELVAMVGVIGGENEAVQIRAKEDFQYAMASDEEAYLFYPGYGFAYAPVVENSDAGYAYVMIGSKAIGKIPVVYGKTVEQERTQQTPFWERVAGRLYERKITENIVSQRGSLQTA